jgi:hypothetical protein
MCIRDSSICNPRAKTEKNAKMGRIPEGGIMGNNV